MDDCGERKVGREEKKGKRCGVCLEGWHKCHVLISFMFLCGPGTLLCEPRYGPCTFVEGNR